MWFDAWLTDYTMLCVTFINKLQFGQSWIHMAHVSLCDLCHVLYLGAMLWCSNHAWWFNTFAETIWRSSCRGMACNTHFWQLLGTVSLVTTERVYWRIYRLGALQEHCKSCCWKREVHIRTILMPTSIFLSCNYIVTSWCKYCVVHRSHSEY